MNLEFSTLLDTGLIQDPGCVPLVIGVAGHRDPKPEHLPVLKERCKQILIDIFNQLPIKIFGYGFRITLLDNLNTQSQLTELSYDH